MTLSCLVHIFVLVATLVTGILGSHFRGGLITWEPSSKVPLTNGIFPTVLFQYRVAFRRSYGGHNHHCDDTTIMTGIPTVGEGSLQCDNGCTGLNVGFDYICTDYSITSDWSSGIGNAFFIPTTNNFDVFYRSAAWIRLINGGGGTWVLRSRVDLTPRTDNGLINSSPTTSGMPIYRMQNGCLGTLVIPATDADGDVIRCRYANTNEECGSICNGFDPLTLDEDTCTLTWTPTVDGLYGVAVQIEDFIDSLSTTPLSSIPLQFLIDVHTSNLSCASCPTFTGLALIEGSCIAVRLGDTFSTRITATVSDAARSIVSINTVSPMGLMTTQVQPVNGSAVDYFIDVTYSPPISARREEIFCFVAEDSGGLTSPQICVYFVIAASPPMVIQVSITGNTLITVTFDIQINTATLKASLRILSQTTGNVIYDFASNSTAVTFPPGNTSLQIVLPNALPSGDLYYLDLVRGAVVTNDYCPIGNEPVMVPIGGVGIILSTPSSTLIEGTDNSIAITCAMSTAMNSDTVCELELRTGTTAENGYDISDIKGFKCVISANSLMGTVNIPLEDDDHKEASEVLMLNCKASPVNTTPLRIIIMDDDVNKTTARLSKSLYTVGEEDVTISYFVECVDANGKNVPIEEELIGASLIYPGPDTATSPDDYVKSSTSINTFPSGLIINHDGTPILQYKITQHITDDNIPENLETFIVQLNIGALTFVKASSSQSVVWIQDNDKPEFCVLTDGTPLPRRSVSDVQIVVFTSDIGSKSKISFSSTPYKVSHVSNSNLIVTGSSGIKTTLSRPDKRSRRRFNEYLYTTSQTIGLTIYTLSAYTYLSATSHSRKQAPIEAFVGPTVTVFPDAIPCTKLSKGISIGISFNLRYKHEMQWRFLKDGTSRFRLLSKWNGHAKMTLSKCEDAGLYIISREKRGQRGWTDFVRVIKSDCPEGMYHSAPGMHDCKKTSPITCENGGVIDPQLGLCTCPPGLAGVKCEVWLTPGSFGSSGNFRTVDYVTDNRKGKCLLYCFANPFGCSCASGYIGTDCCQKCPKGKFGVNCESECHCVDEECDEHTGVCANGCSTGFSGYNCQC